MPRLAQLVLTKDERIGQLEALLEKANANQRP
jgi:hypothetical protein